MNAKKKPQPPTHPALPVAPPGYRLVRDRGRGRPPKYGPAPPGAKYYSIRLTDAEERAVGELLRTMRGAASMTSR